MFVDYDSTSRASSGRRVLLSMDHGWLDTGAVRLLTIKKAPLRVRFPTTTGEGQILSLCTQLTATKVGQHERAVGCQLEAGVMGYLPYVAIRISEVAGVAAVEGPCGRFRHRSSRGLSGP